MKNYDHYVNDVEIMKVAYNAAASFRHVLSSDEIKSCILLALYRAINKYDKRNKTKFTSYLHNGVVFECLSQRKFNKRNSSQLDMHIKDNRNEISEIETKELIQSVCDDPCLVFDRYYHNMTIKELAEKRKVCPETIRIKLNKNLEKLKRELKKVYNS